MLQRIKNEYIYISTFGRIFRALKAIEAKPDQIVPTQIAEFSKKTPNAIAIYYEDKEISYKELIDRSNKYSQWFLNNNLSKGDVVALMMENRPEFLACWIGITQAGGTVALINTNLSGQPLDYSLGISQASNLILGSELSESFSTASDKTKSNFKTWIQGDYNDSNYFEDLDQCLNDFSADKPEFDYKITNDDDALYIYTSGTTGNPKAAKISHKRLRLMMLGFKGAVQPNKKDRVYNVLPLYHSAGGVIAVGLALTSGASLVLKRKFSVNEFWDDVHKYKVTIFQYIGELCRYLLNAPYHKHEKDHNLRVVSGNGLRPDIWDNFKERFKITNILEFYGATEGNVSLMNYDGKSGAIGRIPKYMQKILNIHIIKFDIEKEEPIRDENGFCIPCGINEVGEAIGEIILPGSFEGYVDKTATNKKILVDVFTKGDQYFRSGDLLSKDELGYVYFVDRIGDTFRWKGENVATSEVAEAFAGFDGILETNVYGVSIPGSDGKAGMAALSTDRDINLENLYQSLSSSLPSYAQPLFLRIKKEIEITGTFKHRKVELVKEGYNPKEIKEPMYFCDHKTQTYLPLDEELFAKIQNKELKL
ncbi:MAG: long-chain-acyl-CoA synthetase [Pseudomonadota bacterium]|nr:long-chain-acyl-CoA synthetase [Pseudomonadota bacterium]MEC7614613.1 long-chain-acyl-CoA synthetase [Pseudomonadota bacterium]MEC8797339.1 long-chain-acyl-CoA synthetase [Pseudomonadota bacterium]|tara:strand:- start:264 stop:2042 length:1779 start_codon:yes stop_codon:yes gene_type:complete